MLQRDGFVVLAAAILAAGIPGEAPAMPQATDEEAAPGSENVAQQLQNPVADLVSIPLQMNVNLGLGDTDENQVLTNLQPVVPIELTPRLNVIARFILPFLSNPGAPGADRVTGVGDAVFSLFFTPAQAKGLIWGVGPVQLLPTASETGLGAGVYGLGPTAVALYVAGPWTVGLLFNQIWSVTGEADRPDLSQALFQPFLSFTLPSGLNLAANTEATANWEAPEGERWSVPIFFGVSQLARLGPLPANLGFGGRYWAEGPAGAPEWGLRLTLQLVLPLRDG